MVTMTDLMTQCGGDGHGDDGVGSIGGKGGQGLALTQAEVSRTGGYTGTTLNQPSHRRDSRTETTPAATSPAPVQRSSADNPHSDPDNSAPSIPVFQAAGQPNSESAERALELRQY